MVLACPDGVSEIVWLRSVLSAAGIAGAQHLGMFTSGPFVSEFDQEAAAPILLEVLPLLAESWMVGAVVRHLGKHRADPQRFAVLLHTYRQWLPIDPWLCDSIGAALIVAAVPPDHQHVTDVLDLVPDSSVRRARRSIVDGLWRLRQDVRVVPALVELCGDDDVCDLAMPALRRAIGNAEARPLLAQRRDTTASDYVRAHTARQERLAANNPRPRRIRSSPPIGAG